MSSPNTEALKQARRRRRLAEEGKSFVLVPMPADSLDFLDGLPRKGTRNSRPNAINTMVAVVRQAVRDGRIKMEELTIRPRRSDQNGGADDQQALNTENAPPRRGERLRVMAA